MHLHFFGLQKLEKNRCKTVPYSLLSTLTKELFQQALNSLIKIDADADVEPIVLLKMICPSTGYTHVLRVPPDMESARKAITWVNWDIDPEDFAVES